jgi:release factor glutamine methyltransferase
MDSIDFDRSFQTDARAEPARPDGGTASGASVKTTFPETTFADLPFAIAPGRVFTPRASTEPLVRRALDVIGDEPKRVADVGTGSGVIGVTLAVRRPQIEVWATDVSPEAVELAQRNAERHGVADRVHVLEGDLLDPVPAPADVVVANLPYLPDTLHDPRYDDEPALAIYAPGDGLSPYRRLLNACREGKLVTPGGVVLIQFHREALLANCWQLEDLRVLLEERQQAAA